MTRIERFLKEYGFPLESKLPEQRPLFPEGWERARPAKPKRTTRTTGPVKSRRSVQRTWYFAYGSNMNPSQMAQRCPQSFIEGPGALWGYRLAFAGRSGSWGGPVATVIEGDNFCEGLVYSVTERDLAMLDQYEGHPTVYRRERHEIVMQDGSRLQCWVYLHNSGPALERPSEKYLGVIRRGYERYGFDVSVLPDLTRERMFVYGTLRQGQRYHDMLQDLGASFVSTARTVPGYTMVNYHDQYPAVTPGGKTAVVGEVYDIDSRHLPALDEFEEVPSLYQRSRVRMACGAELAAYLMPSWRTQDYPVIPTGDWTRPTSNRRRTP